MTSRTNTIALLFRRSAAVSIAALFLASCVGGAGSPVSPSLSSLSAESPVGMTGTWSGSASDTFAQSSVTWMITESVGNLSGSMSLQDPVRGISGSGSMRGAVNGTTLTFHMEVQNGGFSGNMASCAMALDGQAAISADGRSIRGTYSGTMTGSMVGSAHACGGSVSNGQLTLTR